MSDEPITVGSLEFYQTSTPTLNVFAVQGGLGDIESSYCIARYADWIALARKILEREAEQRGRDDFIDDAHRNSSELGKRKSP